MVIRCALAPPRQSLAGSICCDLAPTRGIAVAAHLHVNAKAQAFLANLASTFVDTAAPVRRPPLPLNSPEPDFAKSPTSPPSRWYSASSSGVDIFPVAAIHFAKQLCVCL